MGTCSICNRRSSLISKELALCLDCIRSRPEEACEISLGAHSLIRRVWGLPGEAPRHAGGDRVRPVRELVPDQGRAAGLLRPEPPFLIASTLMVPGYIDAQEVGCIAGFIASLNPEIPCSLLAFHPDYKMTDLAVTSRQQVEECVEAARQAGLKRVRVGNIHLLELT